MHGTVEDRVINNRLSKSYLFECELDGDRLKNPGSLPIRPR